jgi:hypothetical protein
MIRIIPLDFMGQGTAFITPADPELHDKVVDFCKCELTEEVNLTHLAKVWVAVEMDAEKPKEIEVKGVMGYVLVPDVPLMRATTEDALRAMAERYNAFLADSGALGKFTFIHVARGERPEQRCAGWNKVLHEWGAKLADRVAVKVR